MTFFFKLSTCKFCPIIMRLLFNLLTLFLVSVTLHAQVRPLDEAKAIAADFLGNKSVEVVSHTSDYCVFQTSGPKGFVVVSLHSEAARSVIGFSTESNWNTDQIPPALSEVLKHQACLKSAAILTHRCFQIFINFHIFLINLMVFLIRRIDPAHFHIAVMMIIAVKNACTDGSMFIFDSVGNARQCMRQRQHIHFFTPSVQCVSGDRSTGIRGTAANACTNGSIFIFSLRRLNASAGTGAQA